MNTLILILVCFVASRLTVSEKSCTKGFMDYDLLVQKTKQIVTFDGEGALTDKRLTADSFSIMPSLRFTCAGNIISFLLGVDVTHGSTKRTNYNTRRQTIAHPTILLWNKTDETTYTCVVDSSVEIILDPSNFSTDGVFQFSLSTPLEFTSNQVLGIYQPDDRDSVVRFYYQNYNGQDVYEMHENDYEYMLYDEDKQMNRRPLIYPETNSPQCISGFISSDEIKIQAREITKVEIYSNKENVFPDIGFTCNGNITHIIIGAQDDDGTQSPQIRFWRLSDEGEYEQTGSSYSLVYNNANDPSTINLRWYNLSQPIQVQNGDVLGIYQPYIRYKYYYSYRRNSDLRLYHQESSGPPNYDEYGNIDDDNNYPLVSVIFSLSSIMSSTSNRILSVVSNMVTSFSTATTKQGSISKTVTSTTLSSQVISTFSSKNSAHVSESIGLIMSSTHNIINSTLKGLPVQMELIGIGTGLVLLSIITFIIVLIIILIVKYRRRTTDEQVTTSDNLAYQSHTLSDKQKVGDENKVNESVSGVYKITDNPAYGMFTLSGDAGHIYI